MRRRYKRYSQRKTVRSRICRSLAATSKGGRGRIKKRSSYKSHVTGTKARRRKKKSRKRSGRMFTGFEYS